MDEEKRQKVPHDLREMLDAAGLTARFDLAMEDLLAIGMTEEEATLRAIDEINFTPGGEEEGSEGPATPAPLPKLGPKQKEPKEKPKAAEEKAPVEEAAEQRTASALDAIYWVSEHLDDAEIVREDAPSGMAWNLIEWVRDNGSNAQDFWKGIFPRVLPTRTQIQAELDRADDNRSLEATKEFLEAIAEAEEAS